MSGETSLPALLRDLKPVMTDEVYTFATVSEEQLKTVDRPFAIVREAEAITVVCPATVAQRLGLTCEGEFRQITLSVHSSLAAVGLTARVSDALAREGISCNVLAAFYHDHLFVPALEAARAMEVLFNLRLDQSLGYSSADQFGSTR